MTVAFAGLAGLAPEKAEAASWFTVNMEQPIKVRDGVTYLPLRTVFEKTGARIYWKPDGQSKIAVGVGGLKYELALGEGSVNTLFNPVTGAATPAPIIDGCTYISFDFMQSLSGRDMIQTSQNQIVFIKTGDSPLWNKKMPIYAAPEVPSETNDVTQEDIDAALSVNEVQENDTVISEVTNNAPAANNAAGLIGTAESCLGVPYVWGGTSMAGFDCSGLTSYVFAKSGIQLPRVASAQQNFATPVALNNAQPGDLVFWGSPAYHVGIYIGNGQYIHAAGSGQVVVGDYKWYPYTSVGRV